MAKKLDDETLGRMRWDDELDFWIGEVKLRPGLRIEVFVEFYEESDVLEEALARARQWLTRVRAREWEYRQWAAVRLLDRRWNKDEPMTAVVIAELLQVASLECASDGTARLYWDDDDVLFYGHGLYSQLEGQRGSVLRFACNEDKHRL